MTSTPSNFKPAKKVIIICMALVLCVLGSMLLYRTFLKRPSSLPPAHTQQEIVAKDLIFCGGISAIHCPQQYSCQLNGNSRSSSGTCVPDGENDMKTLDPLEEYPAIIESAQADAAGEADTTLTYVKVIRVSEARWYDDHFGCAPIGTPYEQAFVPGYQVMLEANGKTYEYHTGRKRHVILCTKRSD
jgi:hypothetical protein